MLSLSRLISRLLRFCAKCLGIRFIPRRIRKVVHFAVLLIIGADLFFVGAKLSDFGFLMLSALIEIEEGVIREHLKRIHSDVHSVTGKEHDHAAE